MSKDKMSETDFPSTTPLESDNSSSQQHWELEPEHGSPQISRQIVIVSTFTADLLRKPLAFWMERLQMPAEITIAPYAQVMQQLLDPRSLLSQNTTGINLLLIRVEDWAISRRSNVITESLDHLETVAREFFTAVSTSRTRTDAPMFIFLCPPSLSLPDEHVRTIADLQHRLVGRLSTLSNLHIWTHADLSRLYPVPVYEDARADRLGHIPYNSDYFAGISTLFTRRIAAIFKPQFKVIAVDCDNTLWKGICGEKGPSGMELTPAHLEFQKLLVHQHDAGMLLCLCSKNNQSDVEAAFKEHPEMPLRPDHLLCWRVNWESKSDNLLSLSKELGLSLDSFIFIDDSAFERSEVQSRCPDVLTLAFPETEHGIAHFMDHVWAFDRIGVTAEAIARTAQYRVNRQRDEFLSGASNLGTFLSSLELKIDVSPLKTEDVSRVTELLQRTNQFNLTTLRRTRSDIEDLSRTQNVECLVVRVRDRFGDYGLVGTLLVRRSGATLEVDTFALSCRVLGRGVEHGVVNQLARVARRQRLPTLLLRYRKTSRNAPARAFLEGAFGQFRRRQDDEELQVGEEEFYVPIEYAEELNHSAFEHRPIRSEVPPKESAAIRQLTSSEKWYDSACRLQSVSDIVREMNRSVPKVGSAIGECSPNMTPVESALAGIWREVLGVELIGVRSDFLDIGGTSLLAIDVIGRIAAELGAELSLYDFFEEPTLQSMAAKIIANGPSTPHGYGRP